MKQKFTLIVTLLLLGAGAFAQKDKSANSGRRMFAIHFNALDAISPKDWKDNSAKKTFPNFLDHDLGFSISYWKLITHRIDFSAKATMLFHDYSAVDRNTYYTKNNKLGLEIEPSVNVKLHNDDCVFNPFVTAGIGAGQYCEKFGAYAPLGVGIQSYLGTGNYLLLQAQYRHSFTQDVLNSNFFYSFGVSQKIGKEKSKVVPPPPPPVVLDRDSDGIPDGEDKCPDVAGLAKYNGCPIPDTDGDGINDEADKCPTVKGLARLEGCPVPDSDNDGVNDEEDKCPNLAGPASNNGCPIIDQKIIEKISKDAGKIYYATGSAKLLAKSFPALDEVASILKNDASLKLDIAGHTDNTGKAETNTKLSQNRANSVLNYLTGKGIAADKLTAAGFGSEKPVADNKTAAGRAKNRRTEMTVRNY